MKKHILNLINLILSTALIVCVLWTSHTSTKGSVETTEAEETEETTETATIAVEDLDLGDYSTEMTVGDTQLLSITVLPYDASEETVSYTSSNETIATVNSMGRITAIASGTTVITIRCENIKKAFELSVSDETDDTIYATDIEINDYEEKLKVGDTTTITATVLPSDVTNSTITFSSSNQKVATVTSTGEVKGIGKGNVSIYVSNGDITKVLKISVYVETTAINVASEYVILQIGQSNSINATVLPTDADQTLLYKSLNDNVASVSSDGIITATGIGNTAIVVSNEDYQKSIVVVVNNTNNATSTTTDSNAEAETDNYMDTILASEYKIVDSEMLKYLYSNKLDITVIGDGYSILIAGSNIVNYTNEFATDIKLSNNEEYEGVSFEINDSNPLCGNITLYIDDIRGKYLYIYNEAKEKYEILKTDNLESLDLTSAGKYLITAKKINSDYKQILIIIIIGFVLSAAGIITYIFTQKRYLFW